MSNHGDEEEEQDYFYESLDRILSSSSSSSSSSVSEDDSSNSPNYASDNHPIPRFPNSISNYNIWISEPSSIQERRKRLLHEMGLANDPSLSRKDLEFGRSVSSDHLNTGHNSHNSDSCFIARSKSDNTGAATSSSPIHCNNLINEAVPNVHNHQFVFSKRRSNGICGSPPVNVSSPNKPPTGKLCRRIEEIRQIDATNMNPNPNPDPNLNFSSVLVITDCGEFDERTDCNGSANGLYKIKNLDDGKEFVVDEFREDGMWNKVKELGTGRQLTMEEFEMSVGQSPIVQELMRRQNVEEFDGKKEDLDSNGNGNGGGGGGSGLKSKKKGSWLNSLKNVASTVTGHWERRSSDERDTSSDKGGRRSSSATDDSQDVLFHCPERIKVRQYGKSCKELSGFYKIQQIQAHSGSIWTIKFSLDGRYLASAGEDCVIHVWQVMESERKVDLFMEKSEDVNSNSYFGANVSPEPTLVSSNIENHSDKKRRGKASISRKSVSSDLVVPERIFALSEKPVCTFLGHLNDVLDLSWSKSQYLLSSSMDKTVRLWHMDSNSCLKMFSHSDYVTCIQFNPVDDRYFISGSLDAKVRIWSIPDRQVVDWNDLHEMVTAACYTPDGQGALVGSHKGSCHLYDTSENKLHQKSQIDLQNKKNKSHLKKITGFQFTPGSSSEVLITSADSRIRVIDGVDLVHKFKGFRNTNSQISASLTANGKHVVCASEDSHVYVWKNESDSRPSRNKSVTVTQSYEHFHCQDVLVAIPWPGIGDNEEHNLLDNHHDEVSAANHTSSPVEESNGHEGLPTPYGCTNSPLRGTISSVNNSYFFDKLSDTWPDDKLVSASRKQSPHCSVDFSNGEIQGRSAWGMVIVTAGLRGEIKGFQNFGLPVRI